MPKACAGRQTDIVMFKWAAMHAKCCGSRICKADAMYAEETFVDLFNSLKTESHNYDSTPVLINGKCHHECCLYKSTPRYHNLPKTLWDPTRTKMQTEIPSRITSMLWKQKIFSLAQTCVIRCSTPCKLSHYSSWVQGMTLLSVLTGGIPFDKILYWTLGTSIRLLTHASA